MLKQIRSKCVIIFLLVLICLNSSAQNIEKCYVNMPSTLNSTLSKQNRLELLEYYKAGQSDSVVNLFGNQVRLLSLDTLTQYLKVKNTSCSTFEMKVFRIDETTRIIGVIRTVCGSVCQSVVEFYDMKWCPTPIPFDMPKAIDWLKKEATYAEALDQKWVENVLENSFITLTFDLKNPVIIAKNNSLEFLSDTDRKSISPLLVDTTFLYRLEGRKWIVQP